MFDVLPPGREAEQRGESQHRRARLGPARSRPARLKTASVKSSPRRLVSSDPAVVQFEWKLPARLRQPIRQQLAKERRKKHEREAIIRFERRAIHTRPLLVAGHQKKESAAGIRLPKRRFFNIGAEHHTGDTYRYTRPQLQVAAPPYVGRGARPPARQTSLSVRNQARRGPVQGRMKQRTSSTPASYRQSKRPPAQAMPRQSFITERDVPFKWPETASRSQPPTSFDQDIFAPVDKDSEIRLPRRFLSIPLSLNIWPINWFGSKKNDEYEDNSESSNTVEAGYPIRVRLQPARGFPRSGVKKNRGESLMAGLPTGQAGYKRIS